MLENCRNARERWGGVSELIDRWLKERQELLVQTWDALDDKSAWPEARAKALEDAGMATYE